MNNYIKINIIGKNPTYFLKEIIKSKINIYEVQKTENNLELIINQSDYEKIKKIKTSYKIEIVDYYGINRLKRIINKYKLFIIFSILGIIGNIVLANLIFKIEVISPNKEIIKLVKKDLDELGIKKYHFKVSNNKLQKIKKQLLKKEKNKIEWLEIEELGTKYQIRIEQRKIPKQEKKCLPRHIVSTKKSIITDIYATTGEIVKKKNDYVEKGEVIISGFIYNKDIITAKQCATGKVFGEAWYKIKVILPIIKKEKQISKNAKYRLHLNFKNKNNKDYQKTEYNIIDSKIIPIGLGLVKYQKINWKTTKTNWNKLDKKAISIATKNMKSKLDKEEKVLSKKVLKKQRKNSKIEVEVFLKVKENITKYVDISKENIEEINKKMNNKEE